MTAHVLYMLVGDEGSAQNNTELLQFIQASLATLRQMSISVKVEAIPLQSLPKAEVQNALNAKGISRLPALKTPINTYFGKNDIIGIYSSKMNEFKAAIQPKPIPASPDEYLSNYYREIMNDKSDDTEAIGDSDQLRKDIQNSVNKASSDKKRVESKLMPPLPAPGAAPRPAPGAAAGPAPRPAADDRKDNLAMPGNDPELIKKVSNEYRQAGDDYNESDDLMLSAYWARTAVTDDVD